VKKFFVIIIKIVAALLLFVFLGFYMVKFFNKAVGDAPSAEACEQSEHFKDGKFQNSIPTSAADFSETPKIMKDYFNRNVESKPIDSYVFEEVGKADMLNDTTDQIYFNWLGHAAILMQYQGKYILMDPMLGQRASPFSFLGPKRYSAPPITAENLPTIEAVVLSHDHYDHLDYETIKIIKDKVKYFYVPVGIGASLRYWGVAEEQIVELDWWESKSFNNIEIIATPARHFSGRLLSQNNTFWASWVIKWGDHSIYFGGDTGIFDGFTEIGKKYAPFDIAFMPIGAYNKSWHDIHLDPEEAVDAFKQLGTAKKFYPIHWGTFDLALHSWYDPIERLIKEADKESIPLLTNVQGKWTPVSGETEDLYWWKNYSTKF
jgi:L-ascorbate metabolism protein UlaG (beta-lactamase superfamily)